MQAVTEMNSRLRKAADVHLVLSWREGERPLPEQAFAAGRHARGALNLADHQYVMAVHDDTANTHLHIVVNRVHPETFRAADLYRDYVHLDRACREIELAQGWSIETSERSMHVVDGAEIRRVQWMPTDDEPTSRHRSAPVATRRTLTTIARFL